MMRFRPAQGLISGFAIDKDGVAYTGDGNSVSVAEPLNLSLGDSKIKIILFSVLLLVHIGYTLLVLVASEVVHLI